MEENVADALKMAGSVLLFVIGLSIAFLYFSKARESIDALMTYCDRESSVIQNDTRFFYKKKENASTWETITTRVVGKEMIIPAIYRAYKENFRIVFVFNDNIYYLYKDLKDNSVNTIDLQSSVFGSDKDSREFLDGILYRKFTIDEKAFCEKFKIKLYSLPSRGLFEYLDDKSFREELGVYYMEDVNSTDGQVNDVESADGKVEDVNKVEKRVITYTEI